MFNALKYTQALENAGFSREQAEVSTSLLIDTMNENFATKSDLKETELRLESKILSSESRLESKIQAVESRVVAVESRLESGLKELEYKLIIKLGTMMTIAIGVFATLVRIIPPSGH